MGTSSSSQNQTQLEIKNSKETSNLVQTPQLPPQPQPVVLIQEIEQPEEIKHPQQNIFDIQNETNKIKEQRKSIDLDSNTIGKIKRELPPLKKIRSNKKLEDMVLQNKHNLSTNQNLLNVPNLPPYFSKSEAKTSARDIQVEEIQEETDKMTLRSDINFRQTRTKKLRLSKQQQNIPGAYY